MATPSVPFLSMHNFSVVSHFLVFGSNLPLTIKTILIPAHKKELRKAELSFEAPIALL